MKPFIFFFLLLFTLSNIWSTPPQNIQSTILGTLVRIPDGTMILTPGSSVRISRPYYLSAYPVTRSQFLHIMGTDPSDPRRSTGQDDPVQQVTWYQAIGFANKVSLAEGFTPVYRVEGVDFLQLPFERIPTRNNNAWNRATIDPDADGYRLPTEIEWLWAAAGANPEGITKVFAGSNGTNLPGDYLWYLANSGGKTHPVGSKLPNELGLYDMSGNVWEWVWDWFDSLPSGDLVDYSGPPTGSMRTHKGGAWNFDLTDAAIASRDNLFPYYRHSTIGFRLLRSVVEEQSGN